MNKRFLFSTIFILLVFPVLVFAITLNLQYPEFGGFDLNNPANQNLPAVIGWLYSGIVILAGLAAFVMLVFGGFRWLVSAGNPSQISEARDTIKKALLGLLLILSSFIIVNFINPELTSGTSPLVSPLVRTAPSPNSVPSGATGEGVYLCKRDNCEGGPDEWLYIDPLISGCDEIDDFSSIDTNCLPNISGIPVDWQGQTRAVRFYSSDPAAQFNIALFETPNFGGRAICFRESGTADRLDDYQLDIAPDVGWAGDPDSMVAVRNVIDGAFCTNPRITLRSVDDLSPAWSPSIPTTPSAMVFLFNVERYGQRTGSNPREFALPLEAWKFEDNDNLRSDNYGAGRGSLFFDIKSVWISTSEKFMEECPPFSSTTLSSGQCAVRFWDQEGKDSDDDGVLEDFYDTDGNGSADSPFDPQKANICFRASQQDLTQYSFEYNPDDGCNDPSNDMIDDIRGLEVIPASDCPIEGVVFNCN